MECDADTNLCLLPELVRYVAPDLSLRLRLLIHGADRTGDLIRHLRLLLMNAGK